MAFTNTPDFEDDFRKVGPDATAGFAPAGSPSNPTEHASSENIAAATADTDEDEELEDDEDLDSEEDDDDEDDLEDDDLEDEDDDEEEDEDDVEDDETEDTDDEEDEDDELEDDDAAVQARLGDAEKRARAK